MTMCDSCKLLRTDLTNPAGMNCPCGNRLDWNYIVRIYVGTHMDGSVMDRWLTESFGKNLRS